MNSEELLNILSDFKLDHPNFEWESRQTCVMNSEELLKVSEKMDYHRPGPTHCTGVLYYRY